jgi:hypothetical protein
MVVLKDTINNDLMQISQLLNIMNFDKLYIFSIINDKNIKYKVTEIEGSTTVKYIEIGLQYYIKNVLINSENHNF